MKHKVIFSSPTKAGGLTSTSSCFFFQSNVGFITLELIKICTQNYAVIKKDVGLVLNDDGYIFVD